MTNIHDTLYLAGLIDEDTALATPMIPSRLKMTNPSSEDHPLSPMADKIMALRQIEGIMEKAGVDIDHLISWMQAKH